MLACSYNIHKRFQKKAIFLSIFTKKYNKAVILHVKKTILKIIKLQKMCFVKVNELNLTQVELDLFITLCVLLLMHPNCFYCSFSKYWTFFIPFWTFILNIKFYMTVNSPDWADENQLKCEKVLFLSEMSEINLKWVTFNL